MSEQEGRLVTTWEVSAFDRVANEWTTRLNHAYDHTSEAGSFEPAQPAKITPSRAKKLSRDFFRVAAITDAQIEYRRIGDELVACHDERKMKAARLFIKALQPELIANLGDNVDLAALSKFDPKHDHFHRTLGPQFQRAHNYYAELRADNPDARIVEVDSNHNERLRKVMMKVFPEMYGVHRPGDNSRYPIMSYGYLANLEAVDVEWISGGQEAELSLFDGLIAFRHGRETSSNGTTASKILRQHPDINSVQGHDHTMQEAFRTARDGRYIGAWVVGALCGDKGEVEGFHSAVDDFNQIVPRQQNWQSSVGVFDIYPDERVVVGRNVPIINGKIYDEGIVYDGTA